MKVKVRAKVRVRVMVRVMVKGNVYDRVRNAMLYSVKYLVIPRFMQRRRLM